MARTTTRPGASGGAPPTRSAPSTGCRPRRSALPTIPTTFTPEEVAAEPLRRDAVLGRYTQFADRLDLTVVTVPNGHTPDGRPASLSLIGAAFPEPALPALGGFLPQEGS
ncbi:hypothetical protein [Dactylosporangium sp. CA-233914]|uniref:hypothetical protein n=1 Tax=Dactylosporangium sp. CA-233914 TaxID=3239934 RepID=UPI003D8F9EA9